MSTLFWHMPIKLQELGTMILYILDINKFEKSEYCEGLQKHKRHHVAGQYLLRLALGEAAYKEAEFAVGEHGKPYIIGYPIHYNISHSGKYVVLIESESEVGVDVQECRSVRTEALAKRFFTMQEQAEVGVGKEDFGRMTKNTETDMRKLRTFYHIWCRKEAYGKYLGVGLNEQVLNSNVLSEASDMTYDFHDLDTIEGYQISICSRKGEHLEKIISVFEGL